MIKRMESEGLVNLNGSKIALTTQGQTLAEGIVRKHRLAECFLIDVLGLSWSAAHHEACKWEHVISADVEEGLVRLLGNPTTCPHGNPIPGTALSNVTVTALAKVAQGTRFTVVRIPEEIEERDLHYSAQLRTRKLAVSAAKVGVGQSARLIGQEAVQIHGGNGVTDEYAIGHYFKRLTIFDSEFGNVDHHMKRHVALG